MVQSFSIGQPCKPWFYVHTSVSCLSSSSRFPNFFVRGQHTLLHNSSRAGHHAWCDCFGLYYILPNQQNFRKYIIFRPIYRPGRYMGQWLGFTDIWVSARLADIIGLNRSWQNAVIFLTHADNLHKKAQRTKSRQLSCSNASRCVFINKQTRWTMEHASTVAAETKASSLIRSIKNHSKILKLLQFEKF